MPANDPTGRRFGEAAAAYERGRPEYPAEIVDWLLADRPQCVVDLGAGTGKLTRLILRSTRGQPCRLCYAGMVRDLIAAPGSALAVAAGDFA